MMKTTNEVVLLYNMKPERLKTIKFVLLRMGVRMKNITRELYSQPIGYLTGIKGIDKLEEEYKGDGFQDEMLVLKGFSNLRIDELLRQLKKGNIEKIQLKAVVTEHNQFWNSIQLYEEIKKEHDIMSSKK